MPCMPPSVGRTPARPLRAWLLAVALAVGPNPAISALLAHGGPVRAVVVSGDGRAAVTASFDYSLIVWDLAAETPSRHLVGHDGPVNAVALAPDGRAAASAADDGAVIVWDLAHGAILRRLEAGAKLTSVALSPDGAEVAAGGWDGRVHRWRLADGAPEPSLDNGGERVTAVAFAGDRLLLAGGHEGSLRAWRAADGVQIFHRPAHGFGLTALALLPDGGLVTGSIDRSLRLWDSTTGDPRGPGLAGHEQPVLAVAASRDGRQIASAGARGEVLLWDAADGRVRLVLAGGGPPVWSLAFTPDGGRLLGGGADGAVRVWDPATGEALGAPLPAAEAVPHGRGPELFAKCSACHVLTGSDDGGGKAGPTLANLFGRPAGSVAGYPYSPALRRSGIVWTEANVARLFEVGPDRMVPGTKMPLQRMPNARDRADLVDYIRRMGGG
jgi:cytochrome c